MSVHDAEPGDIYVDKDGKLWRVVGVCKDPTVTVEEVEGSIGRHGRIQKDHQNGGVGGLMWAGFRRIFRPDRPGGNS